MKKINKVKSKFALLLGILSFTQLKAQEGLPVFSDYLTDNYYLIHPSMAGISSCSQLRLTARRSWTSQKDAPGLQTLSYNTRFNRSSAMGVNLFNDKNGFHSQSGGYVTYAHHLMFSRDEVDLNMLSFGLSAGVLQYRLDQSEFVVGNDQLVQNSTLNTTEFNMDFGFSYHLGEFYTHVTVKNLLENEGVNNEAQITNNLRRYLFSLGYGFQKFGSKFLLEPSILYQYREGTQQSNIDINAKAYYELDRKTIYGGVSYRRALDESKFQLTDQTITLEQLNYVTPFIGVRTGKYHFAYTYTAQINANVFNQGGQHQITLGIDLNCRIVRKACNCPALN